MKMTAARARAYAVAHVSSRYGAPMGRHGFGAAATGKLYCARMPLDAGGYDAGGAYWGHDTRGRALYYVTDGDGFLRYYRAGCRKHALAYALADCADAPAGWSGRLLPDSRYGLSPCMTAKPDGAPGGLVPGFMVYFCGWQYLATVAGARIDAARFCWEHLAELLGGAE